MSYCCAGCGDCQCSGCDSMGGCECSCPPGGCHGCDCTRETVQFPTDAPKGFRAPMGDPLDLSAVPMPAGRKIYGRGGAFRLTPARQVTRLSLRPGDRVRSRIGLSGVEEYAGRACLDVRNDKGQPAGDPCQVFCGAGDVASWSRLVRKLISNGRASCHRTGKCQRVEELAAKFDDDTSAIGQIKFVTSGRLIQLSLAPIAQELACLVTDASKVGPHPDAPRPLPPAPPVGPGPSTRPPLIPPGAWGGAGVGLAVAAVVAMVVLARN